MPDRWPMLRWMQGTGNRFALVNQSELLGWDPAVLVGSLAEKSDGLDGLLVLNTTMDAADIHMRIFNADGSEAWMCGNGLRCVIFDQMLQQNMKRDTVRIQVGRHELAGRVVSASGQEAMVCTRMPVPTVERIDGHLHVELGNAHVILIHDQIPSDEAWASRVQELHDQGLRDMNLHAVQILADDTIAMTSWERGVGPTLACASGATAAVAALAFTNQINGRALVQQPGGNLHVHWRGQGIQPTNFGMVGFVKIDENDVLQNECEASSS